MFEINAEIFNEVKEIPAGNIGAIIGLKNTSTGDTIISSSYYNFLKNDPNSRAIFSLSGVVIPAPVFFFAALNQKDNHINNNLIFHFKCYNKKIQVSRLGKILIQDKRLLVAWGNYTLRFFITDY